jgi:Creatinase/Prolidase N-terminal domain
MRTLFLPRIPTWCDTPIAGHRHHQHSDAPQHAISGQARHITAGLIAGLYAQSEYAPVHQERRRYVSNFTGSAGTALLTGDKALLWTDGRYFLQAHMASTLIIPSHQYHALCSSRFILRQNCAQQTAEAAHARAQAEQQLGPDWTLQKADTPGVLDLPTWLAKNMPAGARVGVDPLLHTIDGARKLQVDRLVLGPCCLLVQSCWGIGLLHQLTSARRRRPSDSSRGCNYNGVLLHLQKALEGAGHELVPVSGGNLVDAIWSDRPQAPMVRGRCTRCH